MTETMTIDYSKIRDDNIREYGEGVRHLSFFEKLYSDGTHFILELLQNAEDARATKIRFELHEDRLEVLHDGRPFNDNDVRGVCGVGETTKGEDLTKIGTFGIGFKSVYAFTKTPSVHCEANHFEIQHYVRPFPIDPKPIDKGWSTKFVIPFDRDDSDADFATSEIGNRLSGLTARTLLFLANVNEIQFELPNGESGIYLKQTTNIGSASIVKVVGENSENGESESEVWLVYSKSVAYSDGNPATGPGGNLVPPVQIAFSLEEAGSSKSKKKTKKKKTKSELDGLAVKPLSRSPLVAFFPTGMETNLGFLAQGPFRTTPARDNIPKGDQWNVLLSEQLAELLAETILPSLKKLGLLTVSCFEAMPIDSEQFSEEDFFYEIANRFRIAVGENELLPAADGSHIRGERAVLGRGEELRSLLSIDQLQVLLDEEKDWKWLSGASTSDAASTFRDFLRYDLEIPEVTPDSLASRITSEFMEAQSDEWVMQFYECLIGWEYLWKAKTASSRYPTLLSRPIIRLSDDAHVNPFDDEDHPNAYLPLKGDTQVAIVKPAIAKDSSSREFLTRLGLTEPDVVAEVIEEILPLYFEDELPSSSSHAEHLKVISAAWSTDSIVMKDRLISKLKDTPFVRFNCRALGEFGYAQPSKVYFPTDELLKFFDENEDAKFVVTSYSKEVWSMLEELETAHLPRVFQVGYGDPPNPRYSTRVARITN